jgi:hypothetical protein
MMTTRAAARCSSLLTDVIPSAARALPHVLCMATLYASYNPRYSPAFHGGGCLRCCCAGAAQHVAGRVLCRPQCQLRCPQRAAGNLAGELWLGCYQQLSTVCNTCLRVHWQTQVGVSFVHQLQDDGQRTVCLYQDDVGLSQSSGPNYGPHW